MEQAAGLVSKDVIEDEIKKALARGALPNSAEAMPSVSDRKESKQ